jgi:hypothetical protein
MLGLIEFSCLLTDSFPVFLVVPLIRYTAASFTFTTSAIPIPLVSKKVRKQLSLTAPKATLVPSLQSRVNHLAFSHGQ